MLVPSALLLDIHHFPMLYLSVLTETMVKKFNSPNMMVQTAETDLLNRLVDLSGFFYFFKYA